MPSFEGVHPGSRSARGEGIHPANDKKVGHPGNTSRSTLERTSHPVSGSEAKGAKGLNPTSQAFRAGLRKRAIKILGK